VWNHFLPSATKHSPCGTCAAIYHSAVISTQSKQVLINTTKK